MHHIHVCLRIISNDLTIAGDISQHRLIEKSSIVLIKFSESILLILSLLKQLLHSAERIPPLSIQH